MIRREKYRPWPLPCSFSALEARKFSEKSRAEYFKERRKNRGRFYVEVEKERLDNLLEILKRQNKTKTDWFNEKLNEELGKK